MGTLIINGVEFFEVRDSIIHQFESFYPDYKPGALYKVLDKFHFGYNYNTLSVDRLELCKQKMIAIAKHYLFDTLDEYAEHVLRSEVFDNTFCCGRCPIQSRCLENEAVPPLLFPVDECENYEKENSKTATCINFQSKYKGNAQNYSDEDLARDYDEPWVTYSDEELQDKLNRRKASQRDDYYSPEALGLYDNLPVGYKVPETAGRFYSKEMRGY